MTDTALLRERIKNSGLKLNFIAERMGLSRFGLAKKINNDTQFYAGEIDKMCEILGITSVDECMAIFFAKEVDKKSTEDIDDE